MSATFARLKLQLSISPAAVLTALYWRFLRRPFLTRLTPLLARGIRVANAADPQHGAGRWLMPLLASSTCPPARVVQAIIHGDATCFGYVITGPVNALRARDGRFDLELVRAQSVHPLLAAVWTNTVAPDQLAAIGERIRIDLDAALSVKNAYPMDLALRALTAMLILSSIDAARLPEPPGLRALCNRALLQGIVAVYCDPEYSGILSNNHHLTSVGLLVVLLEGIEPSPLARWLRRCARHWLSRAARQQFFADGAHFESSSGYHMASAEVIALTVLALSAQAHSNRHSAHDVLIRILKAGHRYAALLSRPDGTWPTIGDFDGGRILRLHARYADRPHKARLAHEQRAMMVPFGLWQFEIVAADGSLQTMAHALHAVGIVIDQNPPGRHTTLAGAASNHRIRQADRVLPTAANADDAQALIDLCGLSAAPQQMVVYRIDAPSGWERFESITHFPDVGVLIARAGQLHLTMRDGSAGQLGMGTHSHLDHLSVDIWFDGEPIVTDPGSWVYAACPSRRQRYRSARAHGSPIASLIGDDVLAYPFMLNNPPARARLSFNDHALWGECRIGTQPVLRLVRLSVDGLRVCDVGVSDINHPLLGDSRVEAASSYFGPLTISETI